VVERRGLVVRLAIAMMIMPTTVSAAQVRKMPRCSSAVREPIAMIGRGDDGADATCVHVEAGGKARSGDHLLEQRQADAGDACEGPRVQEL
jgi:hypothetical protein